MHARPMPRFRNPNRSRSTATVRRFFRYAMRDCVCRIDSREQNARGITAAFAFAHGPASRAG
ncbi:hypothetical protein WT94_31200 [Burkholderia stagnalis]|nr:hypothetical protein WT76_19790 [Burkholderia stagnalis]KWO32165.1 hypothetical protein WT94_31200 [Burkholderia stagnalis]